MNLAAIVATTWATFACTGSPENAALPAWLAYSPERRAKMAFDAECRLITDPDGDARPLWERIVTRG